MAKSTRTPAECRAFWLAAALAPLLAQGSPASGQSPKAEFKRLAPAAQPSPASLQALPKQALMVELVKLIKQDDLQLRSRAVLELRILGPRLEPAAVVPILLDYLEDEDPQVRAGAAKVLGSMRGQGFLAAGRLRLLKVRDPDPRVREAAAYALGNMPEFADDKTALHLARLLKDPDAGVRLRACQELESLGCRLLPGELAEPLAGDLADEDPGVQTAAARVLGAMGFKAQGALPILASLAEQSPEGRVRQAARGAAQGIERSLATARMGWPSPDNDLIVPTQVGPFCQ